MNYWLLLVVTIALGGLTQLYINSSYRKWSKVAISSRRTGAQAARAMLDSNGLSAVRIECVSGELTDHYDPKANVLRLSEGVYNGYGVAATAVACHEAGHAVQHAQHYAPAQIRMALVPAVNFASNTWIILFFAGLLLNIFGLLYVAIVMFAVAVIFQVVTLPVEFDASKRALAYVDGLGLPLAESKGAKTVLTAAALTYVAAALTSILQLIYYIGIARRD